MNEMSPNKYADNLMGHTQSIRSWLREYDHFAESIRSPDLELYDNFAENIRPFNWK